MDPMDIVGKSKEDVSLPKSTMFKIIKEMLPPDVRVARDTQDLLVECCVGSYHSLFYRNCFHIIPGYLSHCSFTESREEKKTIAPEHVIRALQDLGFKEYIEEVYAAYEQHKLDTMDSPKASKFTGVEMSEEEAVAEQQRMFAEARARMNNGAAKPKESELEPQKQPQLQLHPPAHQPSQVYGQPQQPLHAQVQLHPQPQQPLHAQVQLHPQAQPQQPLHAQVQLHPQPQQPPQPQLQLQPQAQPPQTLQPQPQLQLQPQAQPQQTLQPQLQFHPQPQQTILPLLQPQPQQPPPQPELQLHPQSEQPTQAQLQPQAQEPQPQLQAQSQTEHGLGSS